MGKPHSAGKIKMQETFLYDNCSYYMEWKERLWGYNTVYGFYENPQRFNFEFNAERLIVRNLALRTADRQLYQDFLLDNFPFQAEAELLKFDRVMDNLLKLDSFTAARFFADKAVNMVCSDLDYREETAIFKALSVEESEVETFKKAVDPTLIENHVLPEQVRDRPYVWIDGSSLKNFSISR
ncbi:hypothetical protein PQ465_09045 [Sphingobacterium oryzagri]|uniref:Uncharacterized protein n=1 Tax=Sphingobacterium oryzagri TaxID=3025669 RepID=A0ABY7WLN1_9SPHI|nr:hypothetical protein [Sphingobacterium sp. KACC 22765]WDF70503.1 hypothetical protein PQ465_09045 [Sphingobacterium sp. KACC 22765]